MLNLLTNILSQRSLLLRFISIVTVFIFLFSSVLADQKKIEKNDSNTVRKQLLRSEKLLEKSPAEALAIAEDIMNSLKDKTKPEYYKALYLRASANSYLENFKIALSDFKVCLSSNYFSNDTTLLSELNFSIARCYDNLSDVIQAVQYYKEALILYQAGSNIYGQAKVLQNIGIIESDRRKDSLAMNYYLKALELYKLVDDKAKQAAVLQNIGVIYSNQENYPKTIEYYKKALKLFISLKNIEGIASVENNLGLAYERELRFDEALKHYQNSLRNFKKLNSRIGLAYIHDNLASLYRRLERPDIAVKHYNNSLLYADSVGVLDFIGFVNSELASLYEETGNFEKSLHHLKIAEQIEDSLVNDETRKKLTEAEAFFQGELKDIDIQKKEFQLKAQHREKLSYLAGMVLLFLMLGGLIWAYRKKIAAENNLKKHQELLEEEVQQRTNELRVEIFERQAAEEADKLKTAFLANMSHEIRTPMNAILAFSNFLKDPDISGSQRNEYVKYINSCSKSLLHLIDDILDTAKIEAKQLKIHISQCYVNSILNELNVYFQNHIKCQEGDISLHLKTDCVTRNYSVLTDGVRLRQVFTNLLDNAFKFTEKGTIEFGFTIHDDFLEFYVSDTGCGIPKDKAELVFKRFGQVNNGSHKVYKGTGLGLSISKNLVELLGGKMWLESVENKGSCFYFTIPSHSLKITDLLEKVTEDNSNVIKTSNWQNFNLLVAEDDDLNYKLIQIALSKSNINILRAKNGEEVLNLLPGKNIQIVLMDIQMPVLDGYETTRRLKILYPDIFVIAQTAFAMADDKEKCIQAGCDDYISKPIDIEELYKKLTFFLERVHLRTN